MTSVAEHDSLHAMFVRRIEATPDAQALLTAREGLFQPRSWREVEQDVLRWAAALCDLGVRPGDPVVQWAPNRYEWLLTDLALHALQAIHVPLHANLAPAQAAAQMAHSGARLAIVNAPQQIETLIRKHEAAVNSLRFLCYGDGPTEGGDSRHRMADLCQSASVVDGRALSEEALRRADPQAIATVLYTSGTTGHPKGIALTHGNLVSNALAVIQAFGDQPADLRLCFLPLSHIYARTCELYTWIARGSQLALARGRETVMEDCQIVRPTLINGVPYFFQRVRHSVLASDGADDPRELRRVLGNEVRACCCGGAALDDETFHFFHERNVPLLPGYGLTESSPVISLSTLDRYKVGAVGTLAPGVEVRIAPDGEILTRGPHVMHGYWKDPEATREVLDADGWLATGDLGSMDEDGYLRITGRKKELIVIATGKKVVPTHLESLLCRDPLILQAMVLGDGQKYLGAMIVPDPQALREAIRKHGWWVWSKRAAVRHPSVRQLFRSHIDQQLANLSPHEQIGEFVILDRGFTPDEGHLTAKLTLCRSAIQSSFAAEIRQLFP